VLMRTALVVNKRSDDILQPKVLTSRNKIRFQHCVIVVCCCPFGLVQHLGCAALGRGLG